MYYSNFDYLFAKNLLNLENTEIIKTEENKKVLLLLLRLLSYQIRNGDTTLNLLNLPEKKFWPQHKKEDNIFKTLKEQIISIDEEINILKEFEIKNFFDNLELFTTSPDKKKAPLVYLHHHIYLLKFFNYEKEVVNAIKFYLNNSKNLQNKDLLQNKDILQNKNLLQIKNLTEEKINQLITDIDEENLNQKNAIIQSLISKILILVGGPGTGKTSTLAKIVKLNVKENPNIKIAICAPTGKAIARIQEVFIESNLENSINTFSTIHRLLGFSINTKTFRYNQNNPLDYDMIIIDEMSMIDLSLFVQLLRAINFSEGNTFNTPTSLILVGDSDQLHSVDSGCVLAEFDKLSNLFGEKFIRLEKNYRFKQNVGLIDLSNALRNYSKKSNTINCEKIFEILNNKDLKEIEYYNIDPLINKDNILNNDNLNNFSKSKNNFDIETKNSFSEKNLGFESESIIDVNNKKFNLDKLYPYNKIYNKQFLKIFINKINEGYKIFYDSNNNKNVTLDSKIYNNISSDSNNNKNVTPSLSIEEKLNALNNFTILTPLNSTYVGMLYLNKLVTKILELLFNNLEENKNFLNYSYPITIKQNDYQNNFYNGDLGLVEVSNNQMVANFKYEKSGIRKFPLNLLPRFEKAFAMTVHSSQGSEFNEVMLVLPNKNYPLLTLELLYTAITRARKKLIIISTTNTLTTTINTKTNRVSTISKFFENENEN